MHHNFPASSCKTGFVHNFPSFSGVHDLFHMGCLETPKKYNLNTQIQRFLMPSNYQHLSEGFSCFVSMCVCAYACVLSCTYKGLVLSCVTVHLGE